MTGDLNLDGHNINNIANINATGNITTTGDVQARDIKATGKIDADGNISAGNWMWAKNGYGDAIGFGGDGYSGGLGRDYEIKMLSNHPLTIHSPTSSRGNDVILDIDGNMRVQTDISSLRNITASGNIEAAKNVKGATLESTGRATVGEFVQVNGTVSEGDSCSTNGLMGRTGNGTPMYCIDGYWTNIVSSKTKNGGMFLPGGMKMMWGTLSENLTDYGSLDGLRYFESKFKTYEPTFIANGKTYKFSNIFSVQFSPVDVGGAAMERMWGTPYSGSFSYAFSSAIKTTMTGTYLAIGY